MDEPCGIQGCITAIQQALYDQCVTHVCVSFASRNAGRYNTQTKLFKYAVRLMMQLAVPYQNTITSAHGVSYLV